MKRAFKIFKSHEEQDKSDERYYERLFHDKKILELEFIRNRYIYYKYGSYPYLKEFIELLNENKWDHCKQK